MATITIDIDTIKEEIYLSGDIDELRNNRWAWHYLINSFHPFIDSDHIVIPIENHDEVELLTKVNHMLEKYGFIETQSDTSVQILGNYEKEERNFTQFANKALQIRNNNCDQSEFSDFTESLIKYMPRRTLYPLQLLSAYHLAFSQNACNFSAPGTGKTSIVYGAYAYLHNLKYDDPKYVNQLLIIGPLSSFGPWEIEYEECFGHKPSAMRLIGGIDKYDKQSYLCSSSTAELTLISYQSLISLQEELKFFLRNNKVMVVLDEAHKAKNSNGGIIAQAVLSLAEYSSARVVLTGTPAPNGYEDLYNMFKFIWPTKNVIGYQVNQLKAMSSHSSDGRVPNLINNISPYFIRIKKSDLNIPPATNNPPILIEMSPIQERIYNFVEKKYIDAMIENKEFDISSRFKKSLAQARIIRLMQAASNPAMLQMPLREFINDTDSPIEALQMIDDSEILSEIIDYEKYETPSKYIAVKDLVESIIDNGGKVIVWATFIFTIHKLKSYLESYGIKCEELYGSIPIEKEDQDDDDENQIITRERIIRDFHSADCSYKVLIANPYAVAESISLHKVCHNAIYIERSFNAAHFVQSKDRIHRYGLPQDTVTNYYFILSKNTIDETIDHRLSIKEQRMNEIMESMPIPLFDNADEDLGDEDIKALIRDYVRRTKHA